MYINVVSDQTVLLLLLFSCIWRGAAGEILFFLIIGMLFLKNIRNVLQTHRNLYFMLVTAGWLVLMLIQASIAGTEMSWRIVGLTKCLCAIPVCVMLADSFSGNGKDLTETFALFAAVMTFTACYTYIKLGHEWNRHWLNDWLELPGLNTCGCFNLVLFPHLYVVKRGEWSLIKVCHLLSAAALFFVYNSTTYRAGVLLFLLLSVRYALKKSRTFSVPRKISAKIRGTAAGCVAAAAMAVLVFHEKIREGYLYLLGCLDTDRYHIMLQAIDKWKSGLALRQLWGSGDMAFKLRYDMPGEPHNFIMEVLMIYGLAGLAVLMAETLLFARYVCLLNTKGRYRGAVLYSVAMAYLCFMLHPFYTTSFISKIYLVLLIRNTAAAQNSRTCCVVRCPAGYERCIKVVSG